MAEFALWRRELEWILCATYASRGAVISEREVIEVRVGRRVLWVGADAFSLPNITRATTVSMVPNRLPAVSAFVRFVIMLAIVTATGVTLLRRTEFGALIVSAVSAVLAAVLVARLVSVFREETYYALVIEIGGASHTALVSFDIDELRDLTHRILDAIEDPDAAFAVRIENYIGHVGDNVHVSGTGNVGKAGR
ncbi:DUF6232 family protein [Streptomyces sp. PvR034]|uniref:DUF6232 family protein n=1 Tax=Streptomyces sp. PvR034 TaxID=3156401 RepID=UPI003391A5CD